MLIPCPSRATHRTSNQKTRRRGAGLRRAYIVVAVLLAVLCLLVCQLRKWCCCASPGPERVGGTSARNAPRNPSGNRAGTARRDRTGTEPESLENDDEHPPEGKNAPPGDSVRTGCMCGLSEGRPGAVAVGLGVVIDASVPTLLSDSGDTRGSAW